MAEIEFVIFVDAEKNYVCIRNELLIIQKKYFWYILI